MENEIREVDNFQLSLSYVVLFVVVVFVFGRGVCLLLFLFVCFVLKEIYSEYSHIFLLSIQFRDLFNLLCVLISFFFLFFKLYSDEK